MVAATFLLFKVAVVAWSQIRSRWIEVLTNCSVDCSLEVDLQQLLLLNFGDFFASNITAQLLWGKYASFICQLTTLLCSWKHWMICQSLILGCISSTMIGNNTRNGSTCNGVNSSNGHSPNRNITVSTCQTIIYIYYLFIIMYCVPHKPPLGMIRVGRIWDKNLRCNQGFAQLHVSRALPAFKCTDEATHVHVHKHMEQVLYCFKQSKLKHHNQVDILISTNECA